MLLGHIKWINMLIYTVSESSSIITWKNKIIIITILIILLYAHKKACYILVKNYRDKIWILRCYYANANKIPFKTSA